MSWSSLYGLINCINDRNIGTTPHLPIPHQAINMSLLEKVQKHVSTCTQDQLDAALLAAEITEDQIAASPGLMGSIVGRLKKSAPGGLEVSRSAVISAVSATAPKVATSTPVVTPSVKLSTSFDWETATDEECDAEDDRLSKLAARSLRKANALKLERQIAATNAEIFDNEAQTLDFNQKGLDASQELAKQRAMLEVQAASAPRLLQMQIDAATSIATDRINRTEAAIDAGKSAMKETPLASEIAAFRAKLTQREMMNRATALTNATPALLGAAQPEKEVVTIDA